MSYIQQFTAMFADSFEEGTDKTDKTDKTPLRASGDQSADSLTKPTKPGFVSFVGFVGSRDDVSADFSRPRPPAECWSEADINATLASVRWDDGWNGEVFARQLEEARAWNDRVMNRHRRRTP
jgi:hypothetical protein